MKPAIILFFTLCTISTLLQAETVRLTSLEWAPYTSKDLPEKGPTVAVAKAAFAVMGYDLVVEFFPWKRAVHLAQNSPDYDGYFPEYYAQELEETFILSEPMGSGPLGFAERIDAAVSWNSLTDLKDKKFGVVSGYVNTAEFDAMVASGELKADSANDDVKNLLKLGASRVDLVVIDQHVMNYLLRTDAKLQSLASQIQFNSKVLEDKKLYICFKKSERGQKLAKIFNEGVGKINVDAIMDKLLK